MDTLLRIIVSLSHIIKWTRHFILPTDYLHITNGHVSSYYYPTTVDLQTFQQSQRKENEADCELTIYQLF